MSEEVVDDVVEAEGRYSMTDLIENGDPEGIKMILGDRTRIRPAGKIRPGIKAPVGSCSPAQKALYERLLATNVGFDAIDAELLKLESQGSTRKSCLRPSNCDFFVVRDDDFSKKSDADLIRTRYADPDGRVRRFPVWFLMSERHKAIPHAFTAFDGGGNLRCVSFYNSNGNLNFRYLLKGVKSPAKPEDWKILDSDDDAEATRLCGLKVSLTGAYHIQIPGIRSAGGVLVNTKSWYGLSDAMAVLAEVRSARGSFSGLFNGEPFFELVKVQQTMKVEGKTTKQWIVTLELTVDMMDLVRYSEPQAVATRAANALQMLTGAHTPPARYQALVNAAASPSIQAATALSVESDDLPAGLGEQSAETDQVTEAELRHQKGIKALRDLGASVKLLPSDLDNLAATQFGGLIVEELDLSQIENFYRTVHANIKTNGEGFAADVMALRSAA